MMQVTEGIYFIPGQDEALPDSHVYVIGTPDSSDLSLIDAGLMGKGDYKLRSIEHLDIDPKAIKRVIMTHTHLDHIGAFRDIRERIPGVELWVHEDEASYMEKGDERVIYGMEMFRQMFQAQYALSDGEFAFKVERRLVDNEVIELGGMNFEVLHIPGHSPGSIGLYQRDLKLLIPGDVVYADYAIGRFDLFGADRTKMRDSLRRLAELEVEILLPGHNRIMKNVPNGYIREVLSQWEPYII